MKQFFSLLDGMMEYRQLKEAIEQGRVPVSLTGAAAAHKTHIIASLVYQLQRPALVIVPDESTAIRFAALLGERGLHFPARDYVLLDVDGASGEFEHQRLGTLSALLRGEARVVVASAESACERTIPKEKLDRIFERFFRLDESRSSNTGGAGLGLAIAKEIVEQHGGAISAASADGVISFTVSLPQPLPQAKA